MPAEEPRATTPPARTGDRAPALSIRAATPDDAPAIAALVRRAFEAQCRLYDDWTIPPASESAETVLDAMNAGVVLVAELASGSALVGSVRGAPDAATVTIGRLVVEPDLQGRGVGTALLQAIEARFPDAERFEMFTGHKSAVALAVYERLGYVRVRAEPVHDNLTLVHLAKERP